MILREQQINSMKVLLASVFLLACFAHSFGQDERVKTVRANGAEFAYVEEGIGEPLVLLHGGLFDYRSWEPQMHEFAKYFRVIAYSRRLYFPNHNQPAARPFSVFTEADDLAAFLAALNIKRVNLVGASIGGFVALVYATDHPNAVATLVLAEPPVLQLVRKQPGGEALYQEFLRSMEPVQAAFKTGDDRQALRAFTAQMGRKFDEMPATAVESSMQNAAGLKAVTLAADPFPVVTSKQLSRLRMPVLIVTGENTVPIHKLVNQQLKLLIPNAQSVTIPKAGHASNRENAKAFNTAVTDFLVRAREQLDPRAGKAVHVR
jgi:non-heme chloroperoxidase